MTRYSLRNYITLQDLFPEGIELADIQTLVSQYCASAETLNAKFADVLDILWDEYQDWFVGYVDKWFCPTENPQQLTPEDYEAVGAKFLRKLMFTYRFTSSRYLYLLNSYVGAENDLLNQLETVSSVLGSHRVNDTPQDGGDFTDDAHTSVYENNASTTTTTTDPMTLMARLKEIQDDYMNVLKAWCVEFNGIFIAPYNEINWEDDSSEE